MAGVRSALAVERWVSHGPHGGSTSVLWSSTGTAGGVYATVLGSGVFYTSAAGGGWVGASDGLGNLYITCFAQDPAQPDTLYAGTLGGIFWSSDGGLSWTERNGGLGVANVAAIALTPSAPATLYASAIWGAHRCVYKSVDRGATWAPTGAGIPGGLHVEAIVVDPDDADVVYAGTSDPYGYVADDQGVYKSVDGGAGWFASGAGLLNTEVQTLTLDPLSSATLYAGTIGHEFLPDGGVYVTHDGGGSWSRISTGLPGELQVNAIAVDHASGGAEPVLYAALSHLWLPMDAAWQGWLYKSVDGGRTWQLSSAGIGFPNVLSVTVSPENPLVVYAGTECGGTFRSTDRGATWAHWSTGLQPLCVNSLAIHPDDDRVIYAGVSAFDAPLNDRGAGVYVTRDGGVTWTPRSQSMAVGEFSVVCTALARCISETIYAASCGAVLYKSTDAGSSWSWRGYFHGIDNHWLKCVVVDPLHPNVAYVSAAGYDPDYPDIYKTEDCGETWCAVASGIVWGEFMGLAIDPSNSQIIYAGSGCEGVYKSCDGGESWKLTGQEILGAMVKSIVVDPWNTQRIFAADNQYAATGVYVSTNGGARWETYNDGLSLLDVEALAIDYVPGPAGEWTAALYAGTEGAGVFRRLDGGVWESLSNGLVELRVYSLGAGSPPHRRAASVPATLYAGTAAGAYRWVDSGDYDGDGDADQQDFVWFPLCMTTPVGGPVSGACATFDFDADGDADLRDFAAFAREVR